MICIVLAAGYATRMYPLTENFPKPLLEVQGKSILNWLLEDVDRLDEISQVFIVSNHKFIGHFQTWLGEQAFTTPVILLDDDSETNESRIGAVKDIQVALKAIGDTQDALVIAGDNVLEFSFAGFVECFRSCGHSCIMTYQESDVARQRKTGIITVDNSGRVTSFEEKPKEPKSDLAVPPFYCYTASDLSLINRAVEDGCSTDAPGSLAAWLSKNSIVHAWQMPGKRYDIGSLDGYKAVQEQYKPVSKTGIVDAPIHHIAIICSDYHAAKRFYVEQLGFKPIRETKRENDIKLDLQGNGFELELFIKDTVKTSSQFQDTPP